MNKFFDKLPFKKLAEKIPAGTRAKVPLLDKAIPFANQIVCGLAVVLLVTVIACSGKGGNSGGGSSSSGKVKFTMASESDFDVELLSDGTASITKYKGNGGNIAVPATIQGVQVTKIGNGAFATSYEDISKSRLTGVQLPEGLKEIGNRAFKWSSISTIIIPDSVTVFGDSIFEGDDHDEMTWQLKSFTFPAGLIASKIIPEKMFSCSGLSGSLVIPEGIDTIETYAFFGCKNLTSVTLPSTIIKIDANVFQRCDNLTEVIIPASVTNIQWGWYPFDKCPKLNLASQARIRELGYKQGF